MSLAKIRRHAQLTHRLMIIKDYQLRPLYFEVVCYTTVSKQYRSYQQSNPEKSDFVYLSCSDQVTTELKIGLTEMRHLNPC